MSRTILQVAYPFAPVGPDAVGGAEQVLSTLDAGLVAAGDRSAVLACAGSRPAGLLHAGPPLPPVIDEAARQAAWAHWRATVAALAPAVDVVHLHGVDFAQYLPPPDVPTVVTLHLPLAWYRPHPLALRGRVHLVCVSRAQRALGGPDWAGVPVIENGVALEGWPRVRRRGFALALGRICPEKGLHDAIEAARRADVALLLGGRAFPYPSHQAYLREEILPRLDRARRLLGPLGSARKRRLLAAARCLVVASVVEETSSLVALEALAAGTPVVARPRGALPEIVEPGRTGFLAETVDELAAAIRRCDGLDPEVCRTAARARFSAARMVGEYRALYRMATADR